MDRSLCRISIDQHFLLRDELLNAGTAGLGQLRDEELVEPLAGVIGAGGETFFSKQRHGGSSVRLLAIVCKRWNSGQDAERGRLYRRRKWHHRGGTAEILRLRECFRRRKALTSLRMTSLGNVYVCLASGRGNRHFRRWPHIPDQSASKYQRNGDQLCS